MARATAGLGVTGPVVADLYKLLVYDPGSFFVNHRDTEKAAGMFATLIIVLPSIYTGGALLVRHRDREARLDLSCPSPHRWPSPPSMLTACMRCSPSPQGTGWPSSTTCGARAVASYLNPELRHRADPCGGAVTPVERAKDAPDDDFEKLLSPGTCLHPQRNWPSKP